MVSSIDTNQKLSKKTQYGFALAISSYSMFFAMNQSYWSFYMTDVALIGTAAASILLILCRALTAVFDIFAGYVLEKVILPWGKYRSFLIFVPTLAVIALTLMFTHPLGVPTQVMVAYTASIAVIAVFFQDLLMSAAMAVVPQIASFKEDRDILSAKRGQGSSLGKIVFGLVATPLILFFNGGVANLGHGYTITAILFGIYLIFSFTFFYRSLPGNVHWFSISKEERAKLREIRRAEAHAGNEGKMSLIRMLGLLTKAKAVCGTVFADAMRYSAQTTILGLMAYYMTQIYDNVAMVGVIVTASNIIAFATSVMVEKMVKLINSRSLYIAGLMLGIVSLAVAFAAGGLHIAIFVVCVCGVYLGVGIMSSLSVSLLSDGCIYSEYETGVELKGFLMAVSILSPSIGMVCSSVGIAACINSIGYMGGELLSEAGKMGLHCFTTLLPMAFLAIGLALFLALNKLTPEVMDRISSQVDGDNSA